ncbi:MAG: hypothetical protein J7463_16690 [Roseiflexus sp.]|nr:hypothetical protein [Roseiflexus sp.]MBO9363809.1 hypothetical protein [Roseiflexus sp.]MBO9382506.1 hypothetical protein [Roseiflexus sp.]MBO9391136.1 hypothetical protein [Roseiflexus sp.]
MAGGVAPSDSGKRPAGIRVLGFEQRIAALEQLAPAFIRATIVGERLYRSIPLLISHRCIADLLAISE